MNLLMQLRKVCNQWLMAARHLLGVVNNSHLDKHISPAGQHAWIIPVGWIRDGKVQFGLVLQGIFENPHTG